MAVWFFYSWAYNALVPNRKMKTVISPTRNLHFVFFQSLQLIGLHSFSAVFCLQQRFKFQLNLSSDLDSASLIASTIFEHILCHVLGATGGMSTLWWHFKTMWAGAFWGASFLHEGECMPPSDSHSVASRIYFIIIIITIIIISFIFLIIMEVWTQRPLH